MKNGEGKSQNSDLCSTSSPEAGGWQTQKAIEEPRVLQVAGITGLWAVLEFNTEATKPSQKERRQTFSERRTNHFSTMLMEEGATILKNGYFSLLST